MRLVLLTLALLASLQPSNATRIRLLLRDASDKGVAGATLTLRAADGRTLQLTTDASGVALSGALSRNAVWLLGGRLAGGQALLADSYPPQNGFRLMLIPGRTRDVLLRLDGQWIVLDPDMIFSPDDPGEPTPAIPAALLTTAPLSATAPAASAGPLPAPPASAPSPTAQTASIMPPLLWWIVGIGAALMALALLAGLARRSAS